MNRPVVRCWIATVAVVFLSVPSVDATSYVMVADEDMTDGAHAIVLGTVTASSVVERDGHVFTEYLIEAERTLKGNLPEQVRVQRPGGVLPDGRAFIVFDMPELRIGQRTLAFLTARADGSWSFEHQLLGVFSVTIVDGVPVAHRSVPGALLRIDDPRRQHRRESLLKAHKPRDLDRFESWIENRVQGTESPGDYYLDIERPRISLEAFSLMASDGLPGVSFHWHEFSNGEGGQIVWMLEKKNAKYKQLRQKGKKVFKVVLKAWSRVFNIDFAFGGKSNDRGSAPHGNSDGVNSWVFRDPDDEIAGTLQCGVGGVLAQGGWSAGSQTRAGHRATGSGGKRNYWDITEGDVVFQDGIECLFGASKPANDLIIAEIGAHENGHALGIGHSELADALMAPVAHLDGRGAAIGNDEKNAAKALDYANSARTGQR